MRLSLKLAMIIGLSSIAFIALTGWFVFSQVLGVLREDSVQRQQIVTEDGFEQLDRFLSERMRDIQEIAESGLLEQSVAGSAPEVIKQFNDWSVFTGPWDELIYADLDGTVIASDHAQNVGRPLENEDTETDIFTRALAGNLVYSDAVRSDLYGRPTLLFAAPVREESAGRPMIGVVIGEVSWPAFEEILSAIPVDDADLFSKDGLLIGASHPSPEGYFSPKSLDREDALIRTEADEQGFLKYYGNGWTLETETSLAAVITPAIRTALGLTVALIAIFILYTLFILFFLHQFVVLPIERLREGVRAFASGMFKQRLEVKSRDEFGDLAEDFNGMAKNIEQQTTTLDKRVKDRTRDLQAALQEEKKLSSIVENSFESILLTDRKGIIQYVNRRWEQMTGYKAKEVVGKTTPRILKSGHQDRAYYENLWASLQTGKLFHAELVNKRKDGSLYAAESVIFPLKLPEGTLYADISRDITAQRADQEKIKELNELRNKFIRVVSHQLRTPLNAIRWNLETLLSENLGKLKKEQKEFIRLTYDADTEIIRRVHDLLTAMDIEEGHINFAKEATSIVSLWGSVMTGWKTRCEVKGIRCEYVPSKRTLPTIDVDAEKIRQVFEKITENAIDYTPKKGKIVASLAQTDKAIRFTLKDSGVGIPKQEQARIFNRFYRATNASQMKPDASGLGLSIAKYYVEQHGGKIGFTSTEGKGTTFWFELPVTK